MLRRTSLYFCFAVLGASLVLPLATGVARSEKRPVASGVEAAAAAAVGLRAAHLRAGARGIPLAFEVNRGQADPVVQYRARGEGFELLLERDGIHFATRASQSSTSRISSADSISLRFAGVAPELLWRGRDELPGSANYFHGNDPSRWQKDVPLFLGAGAVGMGPGVDCLVYAGERGPEMDFDVARGAGLRRVRLEVNGARSLRLSPEGDLLIEGRTAVIRLRNPAFYQMSAGRRVSVEGRYALLSNHEIGFRVGTYDRNLPLVIDPSVAVTYTTFLGGAGADSANSVALDSSGAVYISGTISSASSLAESATKKLGPGGGSNDFFVAKIDPTQTGAASLVYLTFVGGSGDEEGGKLAVMPGSGVVALLGTTTSADYFVTDSTKLVKGTSDLALTLLGPGGDSIVFSTLLDGTGAFGTEASPAVAFDPSGNVLVAADTTAADLPVTAGAYGTVFGGGTTDGMVATYSAAGSLSYLSYFGINGYTDINGVAQTVTVGVSGLAVDLLGHAYVAGFTSQPGTGFPVTNGFQTTYGGGAFDGFLISLKPKGLGAEDLIYSTFLGGTDSDQSFAVAVDQAIPANAYVVGTTTSSDALTTPTLTGFQSALHGTANAFLAAVGQSQAGVASLSYATYLGGSASDSALGVVSLGTDAVYVTGHAGSFDFPTLNTLQSFSGTGDAFLAKLDTTAAGAASLLYATLLGGGSDSQGNGVAALPTGEIIVAGSTTSNDFPLRGNPQTGVQPICASCQASPAAPDAFVVAFAESAATGPIASFNAPQLDFGNQPVGSPNPPQIGILTNAGTAALTISGIAITGANSSDFSQSNDCPLGPAALAPQATCQITVNFAPSIPGAETAAISFTDDAVGSPQSINLTGAGQEPLATLSAASINFGNQPAGTTASLPLTLTNNGNLGLQIFNASLVGTNVDDFQFMFPANQSCLGNQRSIPPSGNCAITVTFAPNAQGNFSASLQLTDNSGNLNSATQSVSLTGTGTAAAPTARLAPAALNFGSESVGTATGPQSTGLSNTGSLPLKVSSIAINGTNASEFKIASGTTCPTGGGTVGISASCNVNVVFSPASTGTKSAELSFSDNASGSPQTVALSGTGISSSSLVVAPANLGFQAQTLKMPSAASVVTLSNPGTTAVQISSVSVVGPNNGDFLQTNNCPATLNPGAGCQASVIFQPVAGGARTASLSFADSAAGSPQIVTLSGTGLVPAVTLSPGSLSFALQLAGTSSAAASSTLLNAGNGGLVISSLGLSGANATEFSATQNCGAMLAPGASCAVSVVFQPQPGQAGAAAATLSINDNALDSPETIALAGSVDDFSLTASTSGNVTAAVSAGATANYGLQINSLNGFAGSVALSCSGAPAQASCSVSPSPMAVSGTGAVPFSVSVSTQQAVAAAPGAPMGTKWIHWPPGVASGESISLEIVVLVLAVLCAAAFRRLRAWARLAVASVYIFVLLAAVALTSCGSASSGTQTSLQPGTPTGTYMLTVTGTFTPGGATQAVSRTVQLTLAVQ
jgi:hypothetical protein